MDTATVIRRALEAAPKAVVVTGSLVAIVTFLVLALQRVRYPYELEWLESGTLEHVRRLVGGGSLYTPPSIDFTQFPYPPVAFAVPALLAWITEPDFWVLRAVSIAATVGTLALLYSSVRHETGDRIAGILAAGVYAASYRVAGAWFDVGKPDSLFLFLALAAVYILRHSNGVRYDVLAGVVMATAIFAKQTAVFVAVPLVLFLLITRPRRGITFGASVLALVATTSGIMHVVTDGWHTFFVWQLLLQHDTVDGAIRDFVAEDMSHYWPVAIIVSVGARQLWRREDRWVIGYYVAVVCGMVAGAFTARLHVGGYDNVLMPACLGLALIVGLVVGYLQRQQSHAAVLGGVAMLCIVQLAMLRYDAGAQLPSAADEAAGDQFVAWVRSVPGDVLIASHPTYAVQAGKSSHASKGGTDDVLRGDDASAGRTLEGTIADAVTSGRFAAIILDGVNQDEGFPANWQELYERVDVRLFDDFKSFRPIVNDTGRPSEVWMSRR